MSEHNWGDVLNNPLPPNRRNPYKVTLWVEDYPEDWDHFASKEEAIAKALEWESHLEPAYHPCPESYHTITIEITVAEYERLLANQKENP